MISDLFLKPLSKTEGYQALVQAVEKNIGKTAAVFGLTEGARTVLAGALSQGRRTLVVTPSDQAALRMAEDLSRSGVSALHFPARELTFYHMAAESRELVHRRIAVLGRLLDEQVQVVCAPIEALLIPLMPVEEFRRGIVKLTRAMWLIWTSFPSCWPRWAMCGRKPSKRAVSLQCAAAYWTSIPCSR